VGVSARTPGVLHKSERAERAARRMRKAPTAAEARLWQALRRLEPKPHFRRQAPIGAYVADFVCHRARLVVEVDGGVHRLPEAAARDADREAWFASRGYRTLRISNDQVFGDMSSVLEQIISALGADTPTPTPPRKGEGL